MTINKGDIASILLNIWKGFWYGKLKVNNHSRIKKEQAEHCSAQASFNSRFEIGMNDIYILKKLKESKITFERLKEYSENIQEMI